MYMIWWCELAGTNLRFGYCWMAEVKSPHSIALTNWSAAPWPKKGFEVQRRFLTGGTKSSLETSTLTFMPVNFCMPWAITWDPAQSCWWYWDVGDPAKFLRPWCQQAKVSRWLEGKKPVILWKNGGSVSKKSGTLVSKKDGRPAVLLQVKPSWSTISGY